MGTLVYAAAGIACTLLAIAVVWRLGSRGHSIPCPVWLRWMVELDNPFTRTNRAAVIVGHLGLKPGMKVADVGCGPGRLTLPLARAVGPAGEVLAMDVQAGMLARTRKKAQAAGLGNVGFLEAGAGAGRMGREHFDVALLVTVLGEIPDRDSALQEIFDALKPGGVLSVTESFSIPISRAAARWNASPARTDSGERRSMAVASRTPRTSRNPAMTESGTGLDRDSGSRMKIPPHAAPHPVLLPRGEGTFFQEEGLFSSGARKRT